MPVKQRVKSLREILKEISPDCGYIVPSNDEYQGEYISPESRRLEYITGFTGSNGIAVILQDKAFFFTDGRYTNQAKHEVQEEIFSLCYISELTKFECKLPLYYNPKLFTSYQLELFKNSNCIAIDGEDLIDQIWENKPLSDINPAWLYPEEYAGRSAESKFNDLKRVLESKNADYVLITKSDSICWLLNIRGNDVPFNPIIQGYLIASRDKIYLFVNLQKIKKIKSMPHVEFLEEKEIEGFIRSLSECSKVEHGQVILYDTKSVPIFFLNLFDKSELIKIKSEDPTLLPKALKNDVELKHAKSGHVKDAIALTQFFRWLEKAVYTENLTESDIAIHLEEFRKKQEGFLMNSFATICGYLENGAIIHYSAKKGRDKIIRPEGMLLIDSGAQYLGCTTDVTRTICFGKPTEEQKKRYTQVLKGHISLMLINFPIGTSGEQIDVLARQYLWMDGVNYAHSTGHGVGSCLNVHEGPQRISPAREFSNMLMEGMILSNEPGFYKDGEYGIRIENLVYVTKSKFDGFLRFENLTLVPYCDNLIDFDMLTKKEKGYLVDYNRRIEEEVFSCI